MAKFTLPEVHAGKTMVLLDKYPFTDGVFVTNNAAALKMKAILCRDYECTLELDPETAQSPVSSDDSSLSVESTKLGVQSVAKVEEPKAELKAADTKAAKA